MAKTKISEFSATPGNNTDIDSINIAEGCAPSGINDAIRELMAQLKDWQSGTSNDPMVIGSTGSLTLSYGTANGVPYLNGSKVLTSGSALVFTSTSEFLVGGATSLTNDRPAVSVISNFGAPHINMLRDDSTVVASNPLGEIRWFSNDSTSNTPVLCAKIESQADGDHGAGDNPTNLIFYTTPDNSTTLTERMRLNSSGNLGLGVTPSASFAGYKNFQIASQGLISSDSTSNGELEVNNNAYRAPTSATLTYINSFAATKYAQYRGEHRFFNAPSGTAGNAISFTQAMTLDASGNLGIGIASPTFASGNGVQINNTASADARLRLTNAGTGTGNFDGFDLSVTSAGQVNLIGWENQPMTFLTNATERARIDSSGNLLVGKTASSANSGTGFEVRNTGFVSVVGPSSLADTYNYYNSTAGAFRFYVNNAGTIFATSTTISAISDERLKENIQDLDTGLDAVMALKPRRFDWKEGKGQDKKNAAGFIAQEFETVFPDSVGTSKAGEDGIDYKNICHEELIPTLVKAIQELKAIVDAQGAEIATLKAAA